MTITLDKPVAAETLMPAAQVAALSKDDRDTLQSLGYVYPSSSPDADLLAILKEHGVAVYRPEDIRRYKAKMRRKAWASANWKMGIPILVALALAGLATFFLNATTWGDAAAVLYVVSGFVAFIGTAITVICVGSYEASWEAVHLYEYKRPIPVAVCQQIANLSKVLPRTGDYYDRDLRFEIHDLILNKRVFDPMLIVSHKGAKYVIAVWDEPSFTALPLH